MPRYNPATIEPKWQAFWAAHRTFAAPRIPEAGQEKVYILDMFPYPSGDGLHVGHPEGYTATDIVSRAARMRGKAVMHPMGYDSFGLPAEEHAIKTGTHPRAQTDENIDNFRRQLKMLGFSYDWDRELATTDIDYFRWTQWIFLQIHDTWFDASEQRGRPISELPIPAEVRDQGTDAIETYRDTHRLAYQSHAPVNWCPALGTVLANEEVIDGKSERGGHPVVRMPLRQWKLRITAYADRLEQDLDTLDWPESIKLLQRNWIGRSEGAEVDFYIGADPSDTDFASAYARATAARAETGYPKDPGTDFLRVYTTRPDTLFGATYMVLAPEHPFVDRLTTSDQAEAVRAYRDAAARKSDLDRTDLAKEKTGVFTGAYAINPVHGQPVPIWIADYVLISYGTGAIMAVPAHDVRDFEFAERYGIDILAVVDPGATVSASERAQVLRGATCFAGSGTAIHSGPYDRLPTDEFKRRITADLTAQGLGHAAVNYKLRDWLFSRQRFWGEPFPILHVLDEHGQPTGRTRAVAASELPIDLPDLDDFKPHGRPEPPLEKAPDDWLYVTIDGVRYKRETNTMPQWAGSCWYYLRFLDPKNASALIDPEIEQAWMPVDLYVGGAEHAVLHLLYARFWHKVLYDRGVVRSPEPFLKLVNQGMILGEVEITGYQDDRAGQPNPEDPARWVSAEYVHENTDTRTGQPVRPVPIPPQATEKQGEHFVLKAVPGIRLDSRAYKMSKSRGNVVNPDTVVREYGADALRLYEMFMGPLEATKPWSMEGVNGVFGFLNRVWRLLVDERAETRTASPALVDDPPTDAEFRELHKTIKKVTDDIDALAFNTAIARMMEFTNFFTKRDRRPRQVMEPFVLLLSPFAPHIAEELWQVLGHDTSLAHAAWPQYDAARIRDASVQIVVQINGKVRGKCVVPADSDDPVLAAAARADARIAGLLEKTTVLKTIVVPGRLVNFVVKSK